MHVIFQPHLIFIALLSGIYPTNGLRCYQCKMSNDTTNSCLTFLGNPKECAKSHCTIFRRELQNPEGQITDFHRGCENAEPHHNKLVITPTENIYYRYCSSDLCNSEDGLQELVRTKGKDDPDPKADSPSDSLSDSSSDSSTVPPHIVIIVPGIGNSPGESLHFGVFPEPSRNVPLEGWNMPVEGSCGKTMGFFSIFQPTPSPIQMNVKSIRNKLSTLRPKVQANLSNKLKLVWIRKVTKKDGFIRIGISGPILDYIGFSRMRFLFFTDWLGINIFRSVTDIGIKRIQMD